ncbi:hypothetical protein HMI56_001148 [Coelomomyces lativittatus]|nr:hypothetical protein HMI56_001148 [Coelomomyces lativittatus]
MSTAKTSLSSKLFLSAFLKRPCILEEEALALLRHCLIAEDVTDADENRPNLDTFVSQCNRSLDAIDMAILRVSHPNRDAHYYILTNYKHDEIAKLATNYKPTVLETFKNVLNSILQSSNGTISSTSILNSISSSSISKAWFEKTILREWQTDYWLEEMYLLIGSLL